MKEIERQTSATPPEIKCLLEIDTSELLNSKIDSQQYWLYTIKAVRTAGIRALKISEGKTASWNNTIKNGKFINLPTPPPTISDIPTESSQQTTNKGKAMKEVLI